ncbi:MAG: sugar transferase [Paludibacteraceae bacterium]|nr:sugar transferase [Paludibacteraceae bacterium]
MSNLCKYIFDRLGALLGLLIIWPVLLVILIFITLQKPYAPAIFKQQRVGRHGKLFTMYKFRTMTPNHGGNSISVAGEARITPWGAILRRYKLDELLELWNILIGDMSFVGPRPDVPGYADCLTGEDRIVLTLRPGITGPASLKYRNEEEILANVPNPQQYNNEIIYPDKVRINKYYATHYSFITDIQMIICTILGKHMLYNNELI